GLARPPTIDPADFARVAATGAAIGSLYALNSWDFPTYLVVALAAAAIGFGPCRRQLAVSGGVLIVAAITPWLPFMLTFVPPTGGATAGGAFAGVPIVSRFAA